MYREPPQPLPENTLYEVPVFTAKGRSWVALLIAASGVAAVFFLVSVVAGSPREIAGTEPLMAMMVPLFAVPAFVIHRRRRRTARITERGEEIALVVDGTDVTLAFPLTLRGAQFTVRLNGVPIREVYLQCIDASGASVRFHETRGAIYGERKGWFTEGLDRTRPGPEFDVGDATALGDLRSEIEQRNG
jgi:hypothetical protein